MTVEIADEVAVAVIVALVAVKSIAVAAEPISVPPDDTPIWPEPLNDEAVTIPTTFKLLDNPTDPDIVVIPEELFRITFLVTFKSWIVASSIIISYSKPSKFIWHCFQSVESNINVFKVINFFKH